ncbi:immunoglobulin domain-containing protein oig-4 [Lepeophtheirus salmonis]|nr:immunoglobulin domain-containing protein oig-4-like [Lepeophtheirus salmonis]
MVIAIKILLMALISFGGFYCNKSSNFENFKWWSDKKPANFVSKFHQRPPNLLRPGILHFSSVKSQKYYLHDKGARIIKSSHFMKRYHLGRKISFVCVAQGIPRPHITWIKDGLELNAYAAYDHVSISEWRLSRHRLKSKVEIDPAMPKDEGFYECQSDNKFSIDTRGFLAKYSPN